jgi:subtilisin-like proprotein convertase family protein
MKAIMPVVLLGLTAAAQANVYGPQAGGPIPDASIDFTGGTPLVSTLNIAGAGTIVSVNSITLTGLSHTWVGDLLVVLQAPNGDNIQVFGRLGCTANATVGNGSDLAGNYIFQNTGTAFGGAAGTGLVPAGTYARRSVPATLTIPPPDNDDFTVFNGDSANGNWTLTINDWATLDTGSLTSWSLDITVSGGSPCPANIVNTGTSAGKVDVDDLLAVIGGWGPCPAPPATCPANIVNTGTSANKVDVDDLLAVISGWGPCPP